MTGQLLLRGFAWLAVFAYVQTLALRWSARQVAARWVWTCGCLALFIHLLLALALEHDWSQQVAYEHIARRTADEIGFRFGAGLYINYVFLFSWIADVVWWWRWPARHAARGWFSEASIQAWFALIMINAAVVFATPAGRWLALVIVLLALLPMTSLVRRPRPG